MKQENEIRSEIPSIALEGNARVFVGDCDSILEYEPESVKLRAGKRTLRVNGKGLNLCNLSEKTVVIRGRISSLEFEG